MEVCSICFCQGICVNAYAIRVATITKAYTIKNGAPIAHHTFQNMMRFGTKVYGVAKMFSLVVTHAMLLGEMENTKVLF